MAAWSNVVGLPVTSLREVVAKPTLYDVVIVGAGPSGSACAYWLAQAGWSVCLIEKKHFPREKTCGDGLTPRSVYQLARDGTRRASSRPTATVSTDCGASASAPHSR